MQNIKTLEKKHENWSQEKKDPTIDGVQKAYKLEGPVWNRVIKSAVEAVRNGDTDRATQLLKSKIEIDKIAHDPTEIIELIKLDLENTKSEDVVIPKEPVLIPEVEDKKEIEPDRTPYKFKKGEIIKTTKGKYLEISQVLPNDVLEVVNTEGKKNKRKISHSNLWKDTMSVFNPRSYGKDAEKEIGAEEPKINETTIKVKVAASKNTSPTKGGQRKQNEREEQEIDEMILKENPWLKKIVSRQEVKDDTINTMNPEYTEPTKQVEGKEDKFVFNEKKNQSETRKLFDTEIEWAKNWLEENKDIDESTLDDSKKEQFKKNKDSAEKIVAKPFREIKSRLFREIAKQLSYIPKSELGGITADKINTKKEQEDAIANEKLPNKLREKIALLLGIEGISKEPEETRLNAEILDIQKEINIPEKIDWKNQKGWKVSSIVGSDILELSRGKTKTFVSKYELFKDEYGARITEAKKENVNAISENSSTENKFISLLKKGAFENIYVHGSWHEIREPFEGAKVADGLDYEVPKTGDTIIKPETDLDAKGAADVLGEAMIQAEKEGKGWYKNGQAPRTTFIAKGKSDQPGLHVDVGEEGGIVLKQITIDKEGKPTVAWQGFIDHHSKEFGHSSSATSIMMNLLARHGLIEMTEEMADLKKFITDVDNFKHVRLQERMLKNPDFKPEGYMGGWHRSLTAIYKDIPYPILKKIIADRVAANIPLHKFLSDEELKIETGKITKKNTKETLFNLSSSAAIRKTNALSFFPDAEKRMEEIGIKETPELGKIFLDVRQNDKKGTGRIYLAPELSSMAGYDTSIMIDLKDRGLFISSTKDVGAIFEKMEKIYPGIKNIRGNMIVSPQGENGVRIKFPDDKSFSELLVAIGAIDKTDISDEKLFRPLKKMEFSKKEKIWLEKGADGIVHVTKKEREAGEVDEFETQEEEPGIPNNESNENALTGAIETIKGFAEKESMIMEKFRTLKEKGKFTQSEKENILRELEALKQSQIDALSIINKEIEAQGGEQVAIEETKNTKETNTPDNTVVELGGFNDLPEALEEFAKKIEAGTPLNPEDQKFYLEHQKEIDLIITNRDGQKTSKKSIEEIIDPKNQDLSHLIRQVNEDWGGKTRSGGGEEIPAGGFRSREPVAPEEAFWDTFEDHELEREYFRQIAEKEGISRLSDETIVSLRKIVDAYTEAIANIRKNITIKLNKLKGYEIGERERGRNLLTKKAVRSFIEMQKEMNDEIIARIKIQNDGLPPKK
jgi:hypothetical protein